MSEQDLEQKDFEAYQKFAASVDIYKLASNDIWDAALEYARTTQSAKSDDYADLFKGTNFGTTDYRKLIREGLEKVAMGYYNGHTLEQILLEAGFVERRKDDYRVLTQSGLDQLTGLAHRNAQVMQLIEYVRKVLPQWSITQARHFESLVSKFESRGSN